MALRSRLSRLTLILATTAGSGRLGRDRRGDPSETGLVQPRRQRAGGAVTRVDDQPPGRRRPGPQDRLIPGGTPARRPDFLRRAARGGFEAHGAGLSIAASSSPRP